MLRDSIGRQVTVLARVTLRRLPPTAAFCTGSVDMLRSLVAVRLQTGIVVDQLGNLLVSDFNNNVCLACCLVALAKDVRCGAGYSQGHDRNKLGQPQHTHELDLPIDFLGERPL